MTEDTRLILEAMELQRQLLYEITVRLLEDSWSCGCGHVNGCNLAVCAVCGRKPGEVR